MGRRLERLGDPRSEGEQAAPQRIGLALSGGGFRAAFFHIGVLARLAELGILPKVEVISTVSGGSIVGALYYLRLKALLESKPDEAIVRQDYLDLVADVEKRLLAGVQENVRARIFTNPFKNLRMLRPSYSRSDRIGDLYDRYFYKEAWEKPLGTRSLGRDDQIELRRLMIEPAGTTDFKLDRDNDRRAKVPALLINATSLNSGHNWRFETIRMGEPLPEDAEHVRIISQVDKSMRLKQGYFDPEPGSREAPVPDAQVDFPLGLAVAASAAVPGVFQPLAITGMYRGIRVQLVDGGVQDNQGIQGLFDRGCRQLIVSDASGQLDDAEKPKSQLLAVLKRSSGIGQNRIRTEQLIDAETIGGYDYALMHLRKGLQKKAVVPGHSREEAIEAGRGSAETAAFDVDPDVQAALSNIRTDLDYFDRIEAHSLELDAYLMSRHELEQACFERLGEGEEQPGKWDFDQVSAKIGSADKAYLAKLEAGRKSFCRLLALRRPVALAYAAGALALFAAILAGALHLALGALDGPSWWEVVLVVLGVALVLFEPLLFLFSNLALAKTKLLYPR